MDGWMVGWTDGWMDGWMGVCVRGGGGVRADACVDTWMYGCRSAWRISVPAREYVST